MSHNDNDALTILTSMGFDISQARSALNMSHGNVEHAVNYLLTSGGGGTTSESNNNSYPSSKTSGNNVVEESISAVQQIQGNTSQYSYENGRSACTFIALEGVKILLNNSLGNVQPINQIRLDQMIQDGCDKYNEWMISRKGSVVEHTSVDEILEAGLYPTYQLLGFRQGMLSNDTNHPSSLYQQLLDCQNDTQWICAVMIKPPETVLICLPPKTITSTNSNANNNRYYIVDSHPRIVEFGSEHAYCRIHDTLHDLIVHSLLKIFPITDLGPDIPEYMNSMYNSFDLYPLCITQGSN